MHDTQLEERYKPSFSYDDEQLCYHLRGALALPAEAQMGTLIGTLEFGVSALDLDVVQGSLEALASLARQHYLAACQGQPGIATPNGDSAATWDPAEHICHSWRWGPHARRQIWKHTCVAALVTPCSGHHTEASAYEDMA